MRMGWVYCPPFFLPFKNKIIMATCYDGMVGISNINCVCDDPNRPSNYNESKSGLFLNQILPMQFAKSVNSCAYGDMWQMSIDSLMQAGTLVEFDIKKSIDARMERTIKNFNGVIGDLAGLNISDYNATKQLMFTRLYFRIMKKGIVTIKRIGLHLNSAINTAITIYDRFGAVIASEPITTVTNKLTWITLATPLVIDTSDYNNTIYYIAYDRLTAKPKADRFHCGCGGKGYTCDDDKPQWNNTTMQDWAKYMMVSVGEVDTVPEIFEYMKCGCRTNNGLFIDISTDCQYNFCPTDTDDIKNNIFYFSLAYAIQKHAALIQIEKIILSNTIDTYLLFNDNDLAALKAQIKSEYDEAIKYLADFVTVNSDTFTTCYKCFNPTKFMTSKILV